FVRLEREEPWEPGKTSLTRAVPGELPLLRHSSVPWLPSLAVNNSVPPTLVVDAGYDPGLLLAMSLTRKGVADATSRRSSAPTWGSPGRRRCVPDPNPPSQCFRPRTRSE